MADVIDDTESFTVNVNQQEQNFWQATTVTYDANNIASTGDGLMMTYTKIGDNEYNHARWFNYYMRNKQGVAQMMHIHTNHPYYCQIVAGHVYKPWYTEDGVNWGRCESQWVWDDPTKTACGTDYGTFSYWFTPQSQYCEISQNWPWTYSQNQNFLNSYNGQSYAQLSSKATSPKGRNVSMLELTNWGVAETNKRHIAMIARQHSGESMNQAIMIEMIKYVVSKPYLLDNFHWYFVPQMNPDGVYGDDSGREFQQWTTNNIPEVNGVRDFLATVDSNYGLDVFFDWHSLGSGYPENNNYTTGDSIAATLCANYFMPRWNGRYGCTPHSNYSDNVAYVYAFHTWGAAGFTPEPSQSDWTITMDILQNDAIAVCEGIYDYYY